MKNLSTDFSVALNLAHPLPEHPNPLFQRDSFLSLNGPWDFSVDGNKTNAGKYDKTILVPFSPETPLSGVHMTIKANDFMHYRKIFNVPDDYVGHDCLLHFDAVDQICDVYWNGHFIGHHESGYFPLIIHLTRVNKENTLEVVANDDTDSAVFPRGKQSNEPEGIWYHPTSGIWQSVWLEPVPDDGYIDSIRTTPKFDEQKVHIEAKFVENHASATAEVYYHGHLVGKSYFDESDSLEIDLRYDFYPWTPSEPNLYDIVITAGYDRVRSYFAMRKFSSLDIGNTKLFALNNKPLFLSGVLDQGYYPESGLTAPSEAAILNDIKVLKRCGYNCVRKHIKIEPLRYYLACDKLGLIVIQDFVNGGSRYSSFLIHTRPFLVFDISDMDSKLLGRLLEASRQQFYKDMQATIERLYNVPSIAIWTIFNEGWGQFDSANITERVRELDGTRLLDSTSGWYDKHVGDFSSHHIYFWLFLHLHNDHKRILSLSEFGGYSLKVENHLYSEKTFGYRSFPSFSRYNEAVKRLYWKRIVTAIQHQGLGVAIFTQLSDVEEEVNGLMTYDRKVMKIDVGMMSQINATLYRLYDKKYPAK
jgi:beta-galactosidase/beta-glucuronidase